MKILPQILKEFWLPLILGIGWTIYNASDKPPELWTVKQLINIFGPTFFFVSWLVAQWYRVKKQQRVEDGLSEISRDVKAIHAPLLPTVLFLTLRAEVDTDDLERLFKDEVGYRAFGSDKPMPPPPVGLPPGITEGRLHWPGGYIDYEGGVVKAGGVYNPGHPGYNSIHRAVEHTFAKLSDERLATAQNNNNPFLVVPSVRIEFFFEGASKSKKVKPSLIMVSGKDSHKIGSVRALDTTLVVDYILHLVPDPANQTRVWSTTDLKSAFVSTTMKFFYLKPHFSVPPESWPVIQNLQLWLGPNANSVFAFSTDKLSTQTIGIDPEPLAKGQAECVRAMFSCQVDSTMYEECLHASA